MDYKGPISKKKVPIEDMMEFSEVRAAVNVPRYKIGHAGKSITCTRCGMTSFNRGDVHYRYCGNCRVFHEKG
jgi:hypothetical protein